jgi:hypothetical protein
MHEVYHTITMEEVALVCLSCLSCLSSQRILARALHYGF